MDIFENCRICLHEINHEPIKMTRILLRFLEKSLLLAHVAKPCPFESVKQNLCAPCFNRISEFQDFLEQCKDSDEFWKEQFEDLKKNHENENQVTFEETILNPAQEDSSSIEADTTVSTTEVKILKHAQKKAEENTPNSSAASDEQNFHFEEKQKVCADDNETSPIDDLSSIDLTCWQDESNDVNCETQTTFNECDDNSGNEDEEIIEYEYKFADNEELEFEEVSPFDQVDSPATSGVDERSFAYEKVAMENSNESTNFNETVDETIQDQNETTQSTFFLTSSIDENGKIKMTYKCPKCDKSFNRIYDIESHYNIHRGVKPFTCNVCGKSFRQKNILTTHQTLHFGKKVECAECGKKFARRSQLILHYRMHRDEKPFLCTVDGCQAAFRQRKQLNDHSFIHTGEKNFQCPTCAKSFHTRKRLQDHIYKVHSQHRYRCQLCEKAFLKPHMLKHHMTAVHNVEIDDVSHLKITKATKTV